MTNETRAAIGTARQALMTSFGKQDAAAMASLYTTDGQLLPANTTGVNGRPEIQAFWQQGFDMGLREAVLEMVELEVHGDTAIDVGRYTIKDGSGAMAEQGKYIVIWKHKDSWQLHRDMWTTNPPAE